MSLPELSLERAVAYCGAIAAIGIVYDACEFWCARTHLFGRFFDWRVIRSRYYILIRRPILSCLFDLVFSGRVFGCLIVCHAVAAILFPFVVSVNRSVGGLLAAMVVVVHCLSNVRLLIGRDGADQMQTIVWSGLFFYCLPVADWARLVAVGLIPAQLVLSYLISGIAKASSPVWRNGSAIALITRTATYCPSNVSRRLTVPSVSFAASWMTIAFELGNPFLLFGGRGGALAFIMTGTLFHVGIALTMGLTTFVFAFVAAFPILYYFAGLIG